MSDPLRLCLAGAISPEVALARLVLDGIAPEAIAARLAALPASPRRAALEALLARQRDGLARTATMLAASGADHVPMQDAPNAALARIRAMFDHAVALAPEASVAVYSLDDPAILAAATAELLDWLERQGLLGPDRDALDLGCGTGRVAAALASRLRAVLGLDLAPGMIAEARRRHVLPNLRFAVTPGDGLAALPDAAFDLILAVDSFPYLMQAGGGLAERHVADAARLLRPGGALAILNLSYRGDPAADAADLREWASRHGLSLALAGARPFTLWDGTAFLLQRETEKPA